MEFELKTALSREPEHDVSVKWTEDFTAVTPCSEPQFCTQECET